MIKVPEFYQPYLDLIDSKKPVQKLKSESEKAIKFYDKINKKQSLFKYEKGKWSIREILGHIIDAEEIFAYRLLCILRGETNALPGFDQDVYVKNAQFDKMSWKYLRKRFKLVRRNTLLLCKEISSENMKLSGNANGHDISVEGLISIINGHEVHHRNTISEKYLSKM